MITGKELRKIENEYDTDALPPTFLYFAPEVAPVISDLTTTIRELGKELLNVRHRQAMDRASAIGLSSVDFDDVMDALEKKIERLEELIGEENE